MHCGTKDFRACWRLTEPSARLSDARIATAALHFIGVFFDCAWCLEISCTLEEPHWVRRRRYHDHAASCSSAPRTVAACTRIAGVALLATRLPRSEPGVRMPICWFPTRAAAFLVPRQIQHPLCLTVLLAGLFTCQSIRTSSTLHAPTHYTRNRPCVLDTPQKNTCHGSNRVPVRARFSPNRLPQPSKILPKSSCLASRGTSPWSASVDSDILGMLNAPLSFQPPELDFQTLNPDNLARIHDTLLLPQPLDDNFNSIRTPPLLKPILSALPPQTMPGDKTIAPEINIANNWHIIPTSGDLLANDTNDLAHFLSLHPFGSWPPKAPPRSNLQVNSLLMTFLVTLTGCELKVSPLLSVTVLCLFRSYNTVDQPVLLHWTVCLSLLQQILAHQNFSRVYTTYLLRHFRASPGRLRLLRQSNSGRKRLHTLNLELIQHHPFIETRTSPHTQPLSSVPADSNTRPLPSNPSQQPQTQSGLL